VQRLEAMAVELVEGYRYVLIVLIYNIIVIQAMAFMVRVLAFRIFQCVEDTCFLVPRGLWKFLV